MYELGMQHYAYIIINSPDKKLHPSTAVIKKFQNKKYSLGSHLNIAYPCC